MGLQLKRYEPLPDLTVMSNNYQAPSISIPAPNTPARGPVISVGGNTSYYRSPQGNSWSTPPAVHPTLPVGPFQSHYFGGSIINSFLNSPWTVASGEGRLLEGDIGGGLGEIGKGIIEGPANLIPIGKAASVALKGGKLLPKIVSGAKLGGAFGTAYGAANAASGGQSPGGVAKQALVGGALGAAAGGALPVAGVGARGAYRAADTFVNRNGIRARFPAYIQGQLTQASDRQAQTDAVTRAGMSRVGYAEQVAKSQPTTKLLNPPQQNFILASQENRRIMDGTAKLAQQYEKEYKQLLKVYGNTTPKRLQHEVNKLDEKYLVYHSNLLDNIMQEPRPKVTATPKPRVTPKASAPAVQTATKPSTSTKVVAKNPYAAKPREVAPGDYGGARLAGQQVSYPIHVIAGRFEHAMNRLQKKSPEEWQNFWRHVENPPQNASKELKQAMYWWREGSNRTQAHATAHGKDTAYLKDWALHPWQLKDVTEEQVANGGPGILGQHAQHRKYGSIAEGEKSDLVLGDNPTKEGLTYFKGSANALTRMAVKRAVGLADSSETIKPHTLDLGFGHTVQVSDRGFRETRALGYHQPSSGKTLKSLRTANVGAKSALLSWGQFHPVNIAALRAGPALALKGHPIAAVKGVARTFRPLLPGGKGYVDKVLTRAYQDGMVDKAAELGMPYGQAGYNVAGTALKGGSGHKLVFERQMPMMHDQVVRSIVRDLEKKGISLSSEEAQQAGRVGNATMGFINKESLNISPRMRQAMSDFMLAGQFTPSKVVTVGKTLKGGVAGNYARADVAANAIAAFGMAAGVGYLLSQKSDSARDLVLRALINPAAPTPLQDKKGNTEEFRLPATYTSELAKLLGIKLKRGDDGHLGVNWTPGNLPDTVGEWLRSRLSPLPGDTLKVATNTDFATKPLYDKTAPAGTKAIQAGTTIVQGALPIGAQGLAYTDAVKRNLPGSAKAILDRNTPGANPLLKSGLSSIGFTPRTDQTVGKARATADYFDSRDKFARSLNEGEKNLFNKIAAPKKDSFGNQVKPTAPLTKTSDYADLVANPDFTAKYQAYQHSQKSHDPLWDLPSDQLRSYMQAQVISKNNPGGDSATVSALYNRLPKDFFSKRDAYFAGLKGQGVQLSSSTAFRKPSMPDNLAAFSDSYHKLPYGTGARSAALRSATGQAYIKWLDQNRLYNNQERADLGLPPLEPPTNQYSSNGSGGSSSASGSSSRTARSQASGNGSGGSVRSAGSTRKYAVSINSGGRPASPRVSSGGAPKGKARKTATSKPKVSIKKSRV